MGGQSPPTYTLKPMLHNPKKCPNICFFVNFSLKKPTPMNVPIITDASPIVSREVDTLLVLNNFDR